MKVLNSLMTISFLWFLTPVNVGTCHLLGHSLEEERQMLQFDEILYSAQIESGKLNSDNSLL